MGTKTNIVEIVAPSSAVVGASVPVIVRIKNISGEGINIMVGGVMNNGANVTFPADQVYTPAGWVAEFIGGFVMPSVGVTITIHSYYKSASDYAWYYDESKTKSITLNQTIRTLEVDIPNNNWGYVTTAPASIEGRSIWHNGDTGTFVDGTNVQVRAWPYTGYYFEKWSDEINGGVSTNNPEYVQPMTEHRAVKCHFNEEAPIIPDQTLEVDIPHNDWGYVTTAPASIEDRSIWHNGDTGTFPYGTSVVVTAVPYTPYTFEKWSDEINGGVSTNNPEYVQPMIEHRAIKCHFMETVQVMPLEIDVEGQGFVETLPICIEGRGAWYDGYTGTFPYGTNVQVTAVPAAGWEFEKWSDEIVGGVSYSNPGWVKPMTEHRAVKCHFREIGTEEPPEDDLPAEEPPEDEPSTDEPTESGVGILPVVLIGLGVVVAVSAISSKGKPRK